MKEMGVQEFVRRLCDMITTNPTSRFAFFLGAGSSVSSGIPAAGKLVKNHWLPKLQKLKTGSDDKTDDWAKKTFKGYTGDNAASFYGQVMEELFDKPVLRQTEIERLVESKNPSFGYITLAQLIGHEEYQKNMNVVLTTNFDDLMSDAVGLYTRKKPLVIRHDSMIGFVRANRTRPLIIKLHGDYMLEPKNTELETKVLENAVIKTLGNLLSETGLVFIGYGGGDKSIFDMLEKLPAESLHWGVYWVNDRLPEGDMLKWLKKRKATWVKHLDFDELMIFIFDEFNLKHPEWKKFKSYEKTYQDNFKELINKQKSKPDTTEKEAAEEVLDRVIDEFDNWWAVELEVKKYIGKNNEKADKIYQQGVEKFPQSSHLLGNYAIFLTKYRKDNDGAEEYYKRAIAADPIDVINLGNYAIFLKNNRKDNDGAEEYYKRAIAADQNDAPNLGNYAVFLANNRKDNDGAEEYYKRAVAADPNYVTALGNYAQFLQAVHKDNDAAEEYYKLAIKADPNNANNTGNYAGFLLSQGKDKEGFEQLKKALKLTNDDTEKGLILECQFYEYAHVKEEKDRDKSLERIKELIKSGVRSPGFDLGDNVERARKDNHPAPEFLETLAKVISDEADVTELDKFPEWKD